MKNFRNSHITEYRNNNLQQFKVIKTLSQFDYLYNKAVLIIDDSRAKGILPKNNKNN